MTVRSTLARFNQLSPATVAGLRSISEGTASGRLDMHLVEIVKLRVSQLNGCAFCFGRHLSEARRLGVPEDAIHMLAVWREAPHFDERERAALAWAEALTLVAQHPVADAVYQEASAVFSEHELADLTGAIVAINGFNRVALAYAFEAQR